jgi:hypothetical protein
VARSNQRLNTPNPRAAIPRANRRGFSNSAESAGESVNALKADMRTEIAMVMANCLFIRPCTPLMKPTGMNTDARMSAMLTTGPDTSRIACTVASFGGIPCSM